MSKTISKTQLIKALNSQIEDQTIKSITKIFDIAVEIITAELKANNYVSFQGFFMIENKLVKGRSGEFNGVKWETKDRLMPKVKLSSKFKEAVQNEN